MSKIRNKISSIEADDNVVTRALGLHPVSESEPLAPVAPPEDLKRSDKATLSKEKVKTDNNVAPKSVATETEEKTPAIVSRPRPNIEVANDKPRWPLGISLACAAIWLIGTILSVIFLFGLSNIANYSAGQLGGLAFFILFPLLLIGVMYSALKNLSGLTHQATRLENAAEALMQVDETVVRRATEMSGVVKREIDSLNSGVDTALTRVSTLQEVLETETQRLGETSLAVEDKTSKITERLSTEREALWTISNAFDEQMKALSQSLDSHSENLAMSTKTAEQKIQEARLSVENTASKINQTSDLIRNNTVEAATTLTGNQEEILKLSNLLKERASELDTIYQKHGQDLNAMIAQLRNEQEVLNQSLEERLSKMRDVALSAQVSAERLTEASEAGRQTVISLSDAAQLSESAIKNRFAEMEEMVKFSNQKAESISDKAARRVQDSLSQTRKEIARIETDMMDLQEKLSDATPPQSMPSTITEPEILTDEPSEADTEIPAKKSRGALKFVPLEDDIETSNAVETTRQSSLVAGLRPTPSNDPVNTQSLNSPQDEPKVSKIRDSLDLQMAKTSSEPEPVQTPIQRSINSESSTKSWWKNLLGKQEQVRQMPRMRPIDQSVTPALGAAASIGASQAEPSSAPLKGSSHDTFVRVLSGHGLSPNAIVDNGCIVEAVENRIKRGTKYMSTGVATRLGEPVRLLSGLLENDPDLKDQAIDFAVRFHNSLTPVAVDTNGLMEKFGSEDGRLFLMCDAALNGLA